MTADKRMNCSAGRSSAYPLPGSSGYDGSGLTADKRMNYSAGRSSAYPLPGSSGYDGSGLAADKRMNYSAGRLSAYPLFIRCRKITKDQMDTKAKGIIQGEPWLPITYKIIGLAMAIHNELGSGHREAVYHDALEAKFKLNGVVFQDEPHLLVALPEDIIVGSYSPDFIVEESIIVELKARPHLITDDDLAQIIGYFAILPQCPAALFINFGRSRLEYRRVLPPRNVRPFQREKRGR
ncbi:MAG: GxxExxY protein [Chloroflexota bacterium]